MNLSRRPDIERFLKTPDPAVRAAVIYGRDGGMVRERGAELAKAVVERPDDPFDVAVLTEADLDRDPGLLEGELAAQSLAGGKRLVRLRLGSDKPALDKLAAEALSAHVGGAYNPEAFLLVEAGELRRDSALRRAAEAKPAAAAIPCYEDETGDVARLIRESLAKDRVALDTEALTQLAQRLPKERGVARQEIERLALYLGPGSGVTAGVKELAPFLGVEPEASLAEAAADAFGAKLGPAREGLIRAFGEGEAGPAAVRALGMHLARLRRVLTLAAAGAGLAEAAKSAGVFWKNEREFLRQARAWTLAALGEVQADILAADKACKQAGSPDELIAERLALQIVGRAKRIGL